MHADSDIFSPEDMAGKTFAFNDPNSTSGYLVPSAFFMMEMGADPKKLFSKVTFSGSHEASILAVAAKKVEIASTNLPDLQQLTRENKVPRGALRVIWVSKLIPNDPIVIRKDLPASFKSAVQESLTTMRSRNPEAFKEIGAWVGRLRAGRRQQVPGDPRAQRDRQATRRAEVAPWRWGGHRVVAGLLNRTPACPDCGGPSSAAGEDLVHDLPPVLETRYECLGVRRRGRAARRRGALGMSPTGRPPPLDVGPGAGIDGRARGVLARGARPAPPSHAALARDRPGDGAGRTGGTGTRFNVGEMTVTRCAVQLEGGAVGVAYVRGRDRRHAELAALLDALLQDPARHDALDETVVASPGRRAGARAARRRRARGALARGVLHDGPRRGLTVLPGLADPTLDSQRIFRGLLEALARPGRIVDVTVADPRAGCRSIRPPPACVWRCSTSTRRSGSTSRRRVRRSSSG